jgi:neutral/alkaline ceramidase-like enzyme
MGSALTLASSALVACSKSTTTNPPDNRVACEFHADCPNSGVCFEGRCNPTVSCLERKNCNTVPVCEGMRCICSEENRCLPVCVTDNECSKNGQCVDGVCTKYPVSFGAMAPAPSGRSSLAVGLGRVDLDFPMGVSMAGYAMRRGPTTPYRGSLGGSNAWLDRPDVRALAFDDGKEMFVLLRLPLGWSTDEIVADTVLKVQAKRGINLIDHIITTAPHSHALPARFWHLVKGLGFGFFGYDEFSFEIFDRMTTSFADAVMMALDAMQPAKLGYVQLDDFDPMHQIHRDRRCEDDGIPNELQLDDRMFVIRVDDANDKPIAVLTHFGMHGTVFDSDNPIITADAPGGVEVLLTQHASKKYDRLVLGFYLQGDAGNISPAGDDLGHHEAERLQVIGERTWRVIEPALDRIQTSANLEIGIVSQYVPISHDLLGYGAGEFYDKNVSCENSPPYFRYGSFQCVAGRLDDHDPSTMYMDGNLDCVFAVECLTNGYPIPQFQKTHLAVARIGDLAFATMPGEPTSQLGRSLADRVKEKIPGIKSTFTMGYSMDHHFYLLTEADWFQGGYEPSRDIWGWKMAPYFADKSVALAAELGKPAAQRVIDNGNIKPMVWSDPDSEKASVPPNESEGSPSDVITDVPEQIERLDLVTFAWRGGHPGVDRPHVVLEARQNDGTFAPVKRPGGLVYDDYGFNLMMHYDGSCNATNCTQHTWRVTWEDARDFTLGSYRLRVEGRAWKSGAAVDYTATSRTFRVTPSTKLSIWGLALANGQIEGRIDDPPALAFNQEGDRKVADERASHFMRSALVPGYIGAPLPEGMLLQMAGTIRHGADAPVPLGGSIASTMTAEPRDKIVAIQADGKLETMTAGVWPTSKFAIDAGAIANGPAGNYVVTLTLTDPIGNSGTITATIAK